MKLTEEQRYLVEKNHRLIYWYASKNHLNLDDWYDLLALELCYTVSKWDSEKSSLSNYFKLRADNLVNKEYAKTKSQKNDSGGLLLLNELYVADDIDYIEENLALLEMMDGDSKDILKLKLEGYTQTEIAEKLGVTQSYISKMLKGLKEEYYGGKGHDR